MSFNFVNKVNGVISEALSGDENDYYNGEPLLTLDTVYKIVIGQRSNGKTYFWLKTALEEFIDEDNPSAYIRRYDETITPTNLEKLMNPFESVLVEKSDGKYNAFEYKTRIFYLVFRNDDGKILRRSKAFLYCVAVSSWEHKKGADRGFVKYIIYDEFMTKGVYLPDECAKFDNVLSSFIRDRTGTIIVLIGNTVTRYCPYFKKYKIDMQKIKQGQIYQFNYGQTKLALEYCREHKNTSKVNKKYFDFEDKSLGMIKSGYWEINSYPHFYGGKRDDCIELGKMYIFFADTTIRWELLIDDTGNVISFISPASFNKAIDSKCPFLINDPLILLDNKYCYGEIPKIPLTKHLIATWKNRKIFFATDEIGDTFENWMKANSLVVASRCD